MREFLTFDDVLLLPKYSLIESRSQVDLSVKIKDFTFASPIIPANMKDVVSREVMKEMYLQNSLSLMHRFSSLSDQLLCFKTLIAKYGSNVLNFVGVSVGVKAEDYENLPKFMELGIKIVCVDIAHLDSVLGLKMVKHIKINYPNILLIAGNVATGQGATRAWENGADVVKIGIGSGSICSTRLEAGVGSPQLSTLIEISETKKYLQNALNKQLYIISDGGSKQTGDVVKALCYADMVMLGNMLAGTDESPGKLHVIDGKHYKDYQGSSTHKEERIEGVKALVPTRGPLKAVLKSIHEGIQSGCSYQSARNLQELKNNPQFCKITNAGLRESNIHDVKIT